MNSAAEQDLARDQEEPCEKKLITKKMDGHNKIYEQFGKRFKLGIHEDSTIRAKIAESLRLNTSKSGDEQLSLKRYVDRMKGGLNDLYHFTGVSIAVVSSSPFLVTSRNKSLEVLHMVCNS